ncbi:MAG: PhoU domain-containing protein [Acutalibacteraceae bacterium]
MFRRAMVCYQCDIEEAKIFAPATIMDNMFSKIILKSTQLHKAQCYGDVDLLLITKYAERMADHATNIQNGYLY